jgi:hypothetical protein
MAAIPLFVFAYASQFIRYMADDFCLGGTSITDLLSQQIVFPSTAGLYYLVHLMGYSGAPIVCLLFLVVFGIGLFLVLLEIFRNKYIALLGMLLLLGVVLACATNLVQSVYWPTGMTEDLTPLITSTFLVWLLLQRTISQLPSLILCFLVAFFGGAVSNAFSIGQFVLLGIFWLAFRNRSTVNWRLFVSASAAGLAIVAILLISGTQSRIASSASLALVVADPSVVSRLLHGFVRGIKDPLIYTFARAPLALAAVLLLPFIAAQYPSTNSNISQFSSDMVSTPRKRLLVSLAAVGLPIAAIISCMMMWGAGYVSQGRLPTRTWINGQFFLLAACAAAAYILGLVFNATFPTKFSLLRRYSPIIAGIIMIVAIGNETVQAQHNVAILQPYSVQADIRDAQLRAGVLKVAVLQSFGLNDLDVPWVNSCMRNFYRLPAPPQPGD